MVGLTDEPQFEINPDNEPEPLPKNLGELGYSAAWKASPGKFDVDPAKRGTALTTDEARAYLRKAGGDKNRARQLARQDGRHF